MTPFLDSLSRHSLLWSNCLSTTPRSAGVLPAITASVPYGAKGFQFGDIPACNSLLPILKENGYNNNVFYACPFSFDRISDYLSSQNIDYMSPFKNECTQTKTRMISIIHHGDIMTRKCLREVLKSSENATTIVLI